MGVNKSTFLMFLSIGFCDLHETEGVGQNVFLKYENKAVKKLFFLHETVCEYFIWLCVVYFYKLPGPLSSSRRREVSELLDLTLIGMGHQRLKRKKNIL